MQSYIYYVYHSYLLFRFGSTHFSVAIAVLVTKGRVTEYWVLLGEAGHVSAEVVFETVHRWREIS